jgi:hypothetical protein
MEEKNCLWNDGHEQLLDLERQPDVQCEHNRT